MWSKSLTTKMLLPIVLILLSSSISSGTSCCEKRERISTLVDAAIDLMSKMKLENISCPEEDDPTCRKPLDCADLYKRGYNKSGVYTIWPVTRLSSRMHFQVFCDRGWTVIQRRGNFGRANDFFDQDWTSYKNGFGKFESDFWLGNDKIFAITNQKPYSVYFALEDKNQNKKFAEYDSFWIDDEFNKYTLHISGYIGTAGDSMAEHKYMKFTTKDKDNDLLPGENCGVRHKSGWWFNKCYFPNGANLNAVYNHPDGLRWLKWKNEPLPRVEIKIRPNDF